MRIKKITLISNNICYGYFPRADDEVEQRLTINSQGGVWFIGYDSGAVIRKVQIKINNDSARYILDLIDDYFNNWDNREYWTDVGKWSLTITLENGSIINHEGSLHGGIVVKDIDVSEVIRNIIQIKDMFVFDGGSDDGSYEKIKILEDFLKAHCNLIYYHDKLKAIGVINDDLIINAINIEKELSNIQNADFDLCVKLLTMLIGEEKNKEGAFKLHYKKEHVVPIIKRMINILENK